MPRGLYALVENNNQNNCWILAPHTYTRILLWTSICTLNSFRPPRCRLRLVQGDYITFSRKCRLRLENSRKDQSKKSTFLLVVVFFMV